jgi:hypothetical protein
VGLTTFITFQQIVSGGFQKAVHMATTVGTFGKPFGHNYIQSPPPNMPVGRKNINRGKKMA